MKIKSLLAAVSMAALIAPAANAVVVDQVGTSFAQPLALELDLASTGVAGTVQVTVRPDAGFFNQGVQHNVTVDLPAGMVFNTSNSTNPPGGDSTIVGDGMSAATGNIFTGGNAGDSQVVFQIAPNDADTQFFTITIPVSVGSCLAAGSGVNVIVETAGGFVNNDADGDNTASANNAPGFGGCASAFAGSVTPDSNNGASDTFLAFTPSAATNYTALGGGADAVLGTVQYNVNGNVSVDGNTAEDLDPATDVLRVVSTIELAGNPGGANGADLTTTNGTITGGPTTWTLTQTGAQAAAGSVISIVTNGAVLPTLQPVVTAATVTFAGAASGHDFISNEPGATGALEIVEREGETFGSFDWNSGPAGAQTVSVYRITGLPVGGTVNYTATIYNSNTGGPGAFLLPQASVTGDASGEAVLVSTTLPGLPAGTVRYDLELNFETNGNLDVDRLMATAGVVTAFNGGANQDAIMSLQNDVRADADN